jgi:hypothetical protein
MELAIKWVAGFVAVGAAIAALTVFDGWDTFPDVTGLNEVFRTAEVFRAVDEQCDAIQEAHPDDTVGCQSTQEFLRDLRQACNGEGPIPADHFLIGVPGTTRVEPAPCP